VKRLKDFVYKEEVWIWVKEWKKWKMAQNGERSGGAAAREEDNGIVGFISFE
jgi:hypothetical protein